jgi:hypothetical protein
LADRAETIIKAKNGLNYLRVEFGEVTVTHDDTVTLDSFIDDVNLLNAYLMKKSDGTVVVTTISDNQLTVDHGEGTDVPCWYMAYGYYPYQ